MNRNRISCIERILRVHTGRSMCREDSQCIKNDECMMYEW